MSKALKNKTKLNDIVSIKGFGAVGDGVTDDTAICQAVLNSGATTIDTTGGVYLIGAGGLTWPAGVTITGTGKFKRTGTPTAPCLNASAAGTYRIDGVSFDDGGHSAQYGCLETNHASAKLYAENIFANNGYSGIWARQAAIVDITGGEFWDTSHNLYFGTNNVAFLPGTIERVTVTNAVSRNARAGGDGLKTVSGVKRLTVIGGRYYGNAQDGLDLFAGVDEAMLIGVESYGNTVNGVDIKIGVEADYPKALWGQRRRVAIIGGYFSGNTQIGIKVYGEPAEGYFQDVLIQNVNIIGNQIYGIQCRGVAPRILGNLLLGNAISTASNYAVIYMEGDATTKPKGGVISHNTIGNNGVTGKTNTGITVYGWDSLLIEGNIIGNTTDRTEAQELDWGISIDATCANMHIVNNQMGALNTYKMNIAAGTSILGVNPGVPSLKTQGTATILSGTTSIAINHLAPGRPSAYTQVRFFPIGPQFGAGFPYTGATSTTEINAVVSAAPSSNMSIGWEVDLTGETNTYAILI
jgi:Right handed beta helix region